MNEKFIEENYDTQNTKNEQQKDLCITSEQLTEKCKKGEIPNGYYWIRLSWGGMIIMAYYTGFDGLFELDDHYYDSDEISEVLAPVPSYDEWQAKDKENQQLEKKLEIAIEALEYYEITFNQFSPVYNIAQHHKRAEEALAKIKELDK